MSDSERTAAGDPEPAPEAPPPPVSRARTDRHASASTGLPDDTSEVPGSPARTSEDEAAPPPVDRRGRHRPKLPVSDDLSRRLGGGRMPGKADRRGPRR